MSYRSILRSLGTDSNLGRSMAASSLGAAGLAVVLFIAGCGDSAKNGATVKEQPPVAKEDGASVAPPTAPPAAPSAAMTGRIRFELAATGLPQEGMWKCRPVFGDINKDGHLDLAAIARLGQGARVWLGDGTGHWREASEGLTMHQSCGGGVEFGDFNHDGHPDLAVGDHCGGVFIYLGDGQGRWTDLKTEQGNFIPPELTPEKLGVPATGFEDIAVGDLDGDGVLDLVTVGCFEGGVMAFKGDGSGQRWSSLSEGLPNTGWGNELVLADFNNDKWLDIAVSYSEGPRIFLNNGKGGWTSGSEGLPTPSMNGIYQGVAAGDLNGDGRLDLAMGNWINGVEVYFQNTDGSWALQPDIFEEMNGGACGVALGDLDGDGRLDLVVSGRVPREAGRYYGLFAFLNDGAGRLVRQQNTGLPETGLSMTWSIAVADVDRDGRADFLVGVGGKEPIRKDMPLADEKERLQVWLSRPMQP